MNNKQYNNVIENTLKYEHTNDSLDAARAIFDNMGVALPQGNIKTVYETIKTDNYMGWKSCTMQEAQEAADKGIAAIGISEDKIVVISANDERPVSQTNTEMMLYQNASADAKYNLLFYQYVAMRTGADQYGFAGWGSLDDAMDYYGRDYTYTYCGGYYNYYYTFSDGSRMYFRVS